MAPLDAGPAVGFPFAVAADPTGGLFVLDAGTQVSGGVERTILRIDPDGTRTVIADGFRGSGPGLFSTVVYGQTFVEPDGRLLLARLVVDPSTGDRVALPPFSGATLSVPGGYAPEAGGTILYGGESGLARYDRVTGSLTVISGCAQPNGCVPIGNGPPFLHIVAIAPLSPVRALVFTNDGLFEVNLLTGDRMLVSGAGRGDGPAMGGSAGLAVEPSGDVLVATPTTILRVDPASGDRTLVSGEAAGTGPQFRKVATMAVEPAGTLAVADPVLGAVVRVDLATGDRTIVAGGPVGSGPQPTCASGAAFEASGRLVIADCDRGILMVSLETGDRAYVSDEVTGQGPLFEAASDVAVEDDGGLLVADKTTLKRVHPVTGNRTVVSTRRRGGFQDAACLALESPGSAIVGDQGVRLELPLGRFGFVIQAYSELRRVDLASGRGELVSGGGLLSARRGSGPGFLGGVAAIAVEQPGTLAVAHRGELHRVDVATGDRTLVSNVGGSDVALAEPGVWWSLLRTAGEVWRVDPDDPGAATLVSGPSRGRGPQFEQPVAILVNADGSLTVVNAGERQALHPFTAVMRVDPATGDRTVLSRY